MKRLKVLQLVCLLFISQQAQSVFIETFSAVFYLRILSTFIVENLQKIPKQQKIMLEKYDAKLVENKELLDLYHTLAYGLGIDPVPLYVAKRSKPTSNSGKKDDFEITAHYQSGEKVICLFPSFFEGNKVYQMTTLIHELRHYMQDVQQLKVSHDVILFCKKHGLQSKLEENLKKQSYLGLDHHITKEVDADSFAYQQVKCSECLKQMQGEDSVSCREKGYIRGSDMNMFIKRAQVNPEFCKVHQMTWNNMLHYCVEVIKHKDFSVKIESDRYADYIPQHLLHKAEQYRKDKEFCDKRLMKIERAVQQGWES